jgi:hypothetical protein
MNSQNILRYWGQRLKLRLDSSQFYDYEFGTSEIDFDTDVLDFNNQITYTGLTIDSSCLDVTLDSIKPWSINITEPYTGNTCDFTIRKRTEYGWTLDFVFNRETLPWTSGSTFYYWGIENETNERFYLDNNLSFSFTDDGRIKWESYHISGYCETTSGYTELNYIASGQTNVLCSGGTSNDFDITIVFKRNNYLDNCDILNRGGSNDYITGWTVTNPIDVITGATEEYTIIETLNKNWLSERDYRLGTLKIYLNGRLIYKVKDWEEVVPSVRGSDNNIVQIWGGGTSGSTNIHTGTTEFNLKQIKYFEEPLGYPNIKHYYKTEIIPYYNVNECQDECINIIMQFSEFAIMTELDEIILTEDNNILVY